MERYVTAKLGSDDFDEEVKGWNCQPLALHSAALKAVFVDGAEADPINYSVQGSHIRWANAKRPDAITVTIEITAELSDASLTKRWKQLAIVLPVAATLIVGLASPFITYLLTKLQVIEPQRHLCISTEGAQNGGHASAVPVTSPVQGDENAHEWASAPRSDVSSIEGQWSSRWKSDGGEWQTGTATIAEYGDALCILYQDSFSYLISAQRNEEGLYVGYYVDLDTNPYPVQWTGRVVDLHRIDGFWPGGRWDMRR